MIIQFGEAKRQLAQYAGKAGKCVADADVDLFVKDVVQQLLQQGASGNLKKWIFNTQNGRFTAPPDLELPVRVKIEGNHYSRAAVVYDKWYEFYDQSTLDNCMPWEDGIVEEQNEYFTVYDPPPDKRVLAVAQCAEVEGSHLILNGYNGDGREVYIPHDGLSNKGEYLSIRNDRPRFTASDFASFTGIQKTLTNGYVQLYWYCPKTKKRGLLSTYRPKDTNPSYRRFRIVNSDRFGRNCGGCFKVTLLGRVRFNDNYADNDIIPISNLRALKLMAQTMQAEGNDGMEIAVAKETTVNRIIENENQYKRTPQASVNFASVTSPGGIKTVI